MTDSKPANDALVDPSISVIMPVYNGVGFIEQSLPPLLAMQGQGQILEVIVVDDSSTDATVATATGLGATMLASGGRLGPGAARNLAAKQAQGEILWFVDADVVVHFDAGQQVRQSFRDPSVTAIFGSYDDRPAAQNLLSQYKNLIHHHYHQQAAKEANTFWSGCGAIRTQDFMHIGGFDMERFPHPSIEDIELGYRLRAAEQRILLISELQCTHLKVWRFRDLIFTDIFRRALPWSRLIMQQGKLTNDLNVAVGERVRAVLAGVLMLAIILAPFIQPGVWVVVFALAVVVGANYRLAALFYRRKGFGFAALGLLLHQFYYLYSSAAFAWSWMEHRLGRTLSH